MLCSGILVSSRWRAKPTTDNKATRLLYNEECQVSKCYLCWLSSTLTLSVKEDIWFLRTRHTTRSLRRAYTVEEAARLFCNKTSGTYTRHAAELIYAWLYAEVSIFLYERPLTALHDRLSRLICRPDEQDPAFILLGRRSFGGFNIVAETAYDACVRDIAAGASIREVDDDEYGISDMEMAKRYVLCFGII